MWKIEHADPWSDAAKALLADGWEPFTASFGFITQRSDVSNEKWLEGEHVMWFRKKFDTQEGANG